MPITCSNSSLTIEALDKRCEICSQLTIKTPELGTYFTPCSSVSIVNFQWVNTGWGRSIRKYKVSAMSSIVNGGAIFIYVGVIKINFWSVK